jgi:hypothetical protein
MILDTSNFRHNPGAFPDRFPMLGKLQVFRSGIAPFVPQQMVLEEGSTSERDELWWQAYRSDVVTHGDYMQLAGITKSSTSNRKRKREGQGQGYEHKTLENDKGTKFLLPFTIFDVGLCLWRKASLEACLDALRKSRGAFWVETSCKCC